MSKKILPLSERSDLPRPTLLDELGEKLRACEERADRLRRDLHTTQVEARFIRDLIERHGGALAVVSVDGGPASPPGASPPRHRPQSESATRRVPGPAREIIVEAGRPMDAKELLERLEATGIIVESKAPGRLLSKILLRAGTFRYVEGAGYWVSDLPWPPAGGAEPNDEGQAD